MCDSNIEFLIFILACLQLCIGIFALVISFQGMECDLPLWNWAFVYGIMSSTEWAICLFVGSCCSKEVLWNIYFHCLPAFVMCNIFGGIFLTKGQGTCGDLIYQALLIPFIMTSALLGLICILKATQMILESFTKPIPPPEEEQESPEMP